MDINSIVESRCLDYAKEMLGYESIISIDLYDLNQIYKKNNKKITVLRYEMDYFNKSEISLNDDAVDVVVFVAASKDMALWEINEILEKVSKGSKKEINLLYGVSSESKKDYVYIAY